MLEFSVWFVGVIGIGYGMIMTEAPLEASLVVGIVWGLVIVYVFSG